MRNRDRSYTGTFLCLLVDFFAIIESHVTTLKQTIQGLHTWFGLKCLLIWLNALRWLVVAIQFRIPDNDGHEH
jgi:hypothetical protein